MATKLDRLLSRDDLCGLGIDFSKAWLRKLIARKAFPKPIRLGERSLAWPEQEIAEWIAKRRRGRADETEDMRRLRAAGLRGADTVRKKARRRKRR